MLKGPMVSMDETRLEKKPKRHGCCLPTVFANTPFPLCLTKQLVMKYKFQHYSNHLGEEEQASQEGEVRRGGANLVAGQLLGDP